MNCTTYYHEASQITQQKVARSQSIDIQPMKQEGEVQADLILDEVSVTTFYGKLYNEALEPVCGEVIKVIQPHSDYGKECFQVVACTKTDKEGKYQVEVYGQESDFYVIVEGKKLLCRAVNHKEEEPDYHVEEIKNRTPITNNKTMISDYIRF